MSITIKKKKMFNAGPTRSARIEWRMCRWRRSNLRCISSLKVAMYIRRRPCNMCSVSSATATSTDSSTGALRTCAARGSGRCEYVRCAAKDSDSDSDIVDAGCTVHTGDNIEDAEDARKDGPAAACASTVQRTGLTAVPDHNGVRFCRVCNAFLPLSMFPKGHRRYTCRPHLWQRIGKKARKAAYKAAPRRRLLASIWTRCWKDVNSRCLGMAHGAALALKQTEIGRMLDALEVSQSRNFSLASLSAASSCTSADRVCKEEGLLTALDAQRWTGMNTLAVLPADLSKPVSKENAVLVTKSTRGVLLDKLRRARKALGGLKAPNTPNDAAPCTLNQAHAESCAETQKHLAALWCKSIQAAALLPVAPAALTSQVCELRMQ